MIISNPRSICYGPLPDCWSNGFLNSNRPVVSYPLNCWQGGEYILSS